jgi:hypothetical protein
LTDISPLERLRRRSFRNPTSFQPTVHFSGNVAFQEVTAWVLGTNDFRAIQVSRHYTFLVQANFKFYR